MTIDWNAGAHIGGTGLRGYLTTPYSFEETVARLITLSGQNPTEYSDEYKTSVEFAGTFNGEVFTLYDYKGDNAIHIGGKTRLDVLALQDALLTALAAVAPTPYTAKLHYDESAGQTHRWDGGR